MKDLSNRTIVAMLAIALVITIVGTGISIAKITSLDGSSSFVTGASVVPPMDMGSEQDSVPLTGSYRCYRVDDSNSTLE